MYSFTEIADPQRLARVADAWPRDAAAGRLGQACDRWICTACLCFGLDLAEQQASGFRYGYSVYQAEYSRNLLFASGGQMEDLSGRILDRTRSRLDIPALRTIFGLKNRPHGNRAPGPPAQEIVIEKPQYGLSWFRIRFGMLQVKAYTKGEHVLRFEATVHNTRELRCRRSLEYFSKIITRLSGIAGQFATLLDCADTGFLPRWRPRPAAAPVPGWCQQAQRHRHEQPPDPGCPVSGARPRPCTPRVHRRRARRQGPPDSRTRRLHHLAGRLRLAQTPRQAADRQARQDSRAPHAGQARDGAANRDTR
jgi:hypothetical protein